MGKFVSVAKDAKGPFSKYSHSALGLQCMNFYLGEGTIQYITL